MGAVVVVNKTRGSEWAVGLVEIDSETGELSYMFRVDVDGRDAIPTSSSAAQLLALL